MGIAEVVAGGGREGLTSHADPAASSTVRSWARAAYGALALTVPGRGSRGGCYSLTPWERKINARGCFPSVDGVGANKTGQ